jgi:SET domain-containing protein
VYHSKLVSVKRVKGKGRGVFARQPIAAGTLIEHVPVLLVPVDQLVGGWGNQFFGRFCFVRGRSKVALALGYGSLYNHSYRPNARYDEGQGVTMRFTALRDIAAGEEITINYNGDSEDRAAVGFAVR